MSVSRQQNDVISMAFQPYSELYTDSYHVHGEDERVQSLPHFTILFLLGRNLMKCIFWHFILGTLEFLGENYTVVKLKRGSVVFINLLLNRMIALHYRQANK